ncbi:UDP-2,3-diacylglucosamine diphosphatase [Ramlibacter sp. AN1015]|uniref:UDP-2,3-diacylglucosamine diphosphatase n=1 Tax=Ramlibacter sp. AN1015 TaxID=3133428 RepID=UPI0030BBE9CA
MHDGTAPASFPVLEAGSGWGAVDFLSDLHLQAGAAATFDAWRHWMRTTPADAVFVLGDLFEAWVGDDAAVQPGFAAECAQVLREAAERRPLYFMAGNRDFLVGDALAAACGFSRLPDPVVLVFAGARWLLSHGDLLCLSDTAYQRYRAQVHAPDWIAQFLRKPLAQREAVAHQMRADSQTHQRALPGYADVDDGAVRHWLRAANATTLIHGHTHRAADHTLGEGLSRIVLSDWDLDAAPPRAQVLRLERNGSLRRIDVA